MDWKFRFDQWITLLSKELRFYLYSLTGLVFILLFLIISGCLLWIIPGSYNIVDNGYATLSSFFHIAPVLFLFLIPALAMRSFAEEKREHTFLLLKSRPLSINCIVFAKVTALFIPVILALLPTLIYAFFLYWNGNPTGNLDVGSTTASYFGLLFLVFTFINLSVFASSITSNQVIALIAGVLFCAFFYFGFDLISLEKFGFLYHYKSIQRGLIETSDLFYFLTTSALFYFLILVSAGEKVFSKTNRIVGIVFLVGLLFTGCLNFRFDWTKDKRYTLHPISVNLLQNLNQDLNIEVYLTGNLNPGFSRLKTAIQNLLDDFNKTSSSEIIFDFIDPYKRGKDFIESLNKEGIQGISVNERLSNGRITQNILYPYASIKSEEAQITIPLLVNRQGSSGEENLNLSIEIIEYQFIKALSLLTKHESKRIVFLEGHDELPENSISEIADLLSSEYTIDRGILSGFPGELDEYNLVVIAGPRKPFSETDKFVLDQYLMQGGSLLWFVDGVRLHSLDELIETGKTMTFPNELNLRDLFFTYGLRVNPDVLQDVQCLNIPLAVINESDETEYKPFPWYYSPLLIPEKSSEITKDLSFVKTTFTSSISLVGENRDNKKILLTTSPYTHSVKTPALVDLSETERKPEQSYFSESELPVAVLVNAPVVSAFQSRSRFFAGNKYSFLDKSVSGKMILVASEDIITNPLGYDQYSQTRFSNSEFIQNAVNYLTDSENLFSVKNKSIRQNLLDKQKLYKSENQTIIFNVILPPIIYLAVFAVLSLNRKRKYNRKIES
ncbi:MAG: gliding motility-associated ABC transporter substrate-binding protein GldG [Dysgonamonadaceae bacterium]|jgi:ABC-2 type transport system permease protein|nr:gliding motility-associated ABC transporter substrate-binding protein GldG [Dysgonamonadaceae bacterium]